MPRTLIAIMSCHKNSAKRNAQRRTWVSLIGGLCDYQFFVGRGSSALAEDEIALDCPDDYTSLPKKIQEMCIWTLAHGYDWMFKTDDDVYIAPDRLLASGYYEKYNYIGSIHSGYCSGGGHWLSRRAMEVLVLAEPPNHPPSDRWVGEVLAAHGIKAEASPAFFMTNLLGRPGTVSRNNNATLAAQLTIGEMDETHAAWISDPAKDDMQGMWVGPSLSEMESLSIRSFQQHGHRFVLYTYGPTANIPDGTVVRDGNDILSESEFDSAKFSSLGAFSDFFRHKLLFEHGGWWADTDTICVKPFDFDTPYVFSSEDLDERGEHIHINSGNIKAPAGCDIEEYIWKECLKHDPGNIPWGDVGPKLVSAAVQKFKLERYVQPPVVFCPIPWWNAKNFTNPTAPLLVIAEETRAVHLWGEMWSRNNLDRNKFVPSSPYATLRRMVNSQAGTSMGDVTALIKTYLRDESLFHNIRTLKEQYPAIHIIVADDGYCTDEKGEKLKAMGVDKYIQLPWDRGLSAGRNALLDACETPFCLIGDDDFGYDKDCYLIGLRILMGVADIAAGRVLQIGKMGYAKPGEWLAYEGIFLSDNRIAPLADGLQVYQGARYKAADLVLNFFVGRIEALRRVRWDENIKLGYEHEDFFRRAKAAGLRTVYNPDVVARHQEIADSNQTEYQKYRVPMAHKYRPVFAKKWGFDPSRFTPEWFTKLNQDKEQDQKTAEILLPPKPIVPTPAPKPIVPTPAPYKTAPPTEVHNPNWREGVTGKKVERLAGMGYDVLVCDPGSPILAKLRNAHPNAVEERIETASGQKILFCAKITVSTRLDQVTRKKP